MGMVLKNLGFLNFKGISCKSQEITLFTTIDSMLMLHSPTNPHSNYTEKSQVTVKPKHSFVPCILPLVFFFFLKSMRVAVSTFSCTVFLWVLAL